MKMSFISARLRNATQIAAVLMLLPCTAHAQGFSLRTGVNVNPDQLAVGAQYQFGPITRNVWFEPNADVGFGDGATLVTTNMDLVYRHAVGGSSPWTLYLGGGSAINFYKFAGYNMTLAGVNALTGVAHRSGLFAQISAGFFDSPQYSLGVGYTFRPSGPRRPTRRR
jgi:hypothetical protein